MAISAVSDIQSQFLLLTAEDRNPSAAYDVVSDTYYDYIKTLESFPECTALITLFRNGINECPTWVSTHQGMDHFKIVLETANDILLQITRCRRPGCNNTRHDCESHGHSYYCYNCLYSSQSDYMSD